MSSSTSRRSYVSNHRSDKDFQVDDGVMKEFEQYLTSHDIAWTTADIKGVKGWLQARIKQKIVTICVRSKAGFAHAGQLGSVKLKRRSAICRGQALEDHATEVLAQKAMARNSSSNGVPVQP